MRVLLALAVFFAAVFAPAPLWACACADVLMPARPGGFAYLQYDRQDQSQNWSGAKKAPGEANADKRSFNSTFTGGVQYMLDRSWGTLVEVPVTERDFTTTDQNGTLGRLDHASIGDIRARGVYSGLSADMSSGLTFGLRLPTGPFKNPNLDRDTQIGSGSTDLLLGGYHYGLIPALGPSKWFANIQWDEPILVSGGYRPGAEIDAALGAHYDGWEPAGFRIAPLAQVLGRTRWRDSGPTSDSSTGYQRVFLSPGLEVSKDAVRVYGDVEFPVYQYVNGYQLVAAELYKLNVGWSF